ncbi:MAG: GNAT family N-acetyltransferase [Candidatus Obscuribacterales bacterium]|nr:GNAT family N-acetyltransferase [Candidatus Obscuribacterales bacterium]
MTFATTYTADEIIRDGRALTIRALHQEDRELWQDVWEHLGPESIYYRFFSPKRKMSDAEVAYFTQLDFVTHVALIAIIHNTTDGDTPCAIGRYHVVGTSQDTAEIAFAVDDEFQGLGIGTLLLTHLARIGRLAGISEFVAFVLAENQKMLEVFENCGIPIQKKLNDFTMWEIRLRLADDADK